MRWLRSLRKQAFMKPIVDKIDQEREILVPALLAQQSAWAAEMSIRGSLAKVAERTVRSNAFAIGKG